MIGRASRILAAPGMRTASRPRWSAEVGTALAVVAGQPHLWLLGAVGFALRGGIVLFTLPILVLPTQVEIRLALGANLGSTGLTPGFWALVATGAIVTAVVAVVVLVVLARIEISSFSHLVQDPESGDIRAWRPARSLPASRDRFLLSQVFTVQALGLLCLCLFCVPLAATIGQATLDELLRPSSNATIFMRVLGQLSAPLALVALGIVLVEMLSSVATRRLLLRASGLGAETAPHGRPLLSAVTGALVRPFRSPLRTARTAGLAWLASFAALIPALWAIDLCWQAARASFLATTSTSEVIRDPGVLLIALLLAAVFGAGLLLAGFASAFRASLWSIDTLSDPSSAVHVAD